MSDSETSLSISGDIQNIILSNISGSVNTDGGDIIVNVNGEDSDSKEVVNEVVEEVVNEVVEEVGEKAEEDSSSYADYDNMFSTFKTSENEKTKNEYLVENYPDEAHYVFPPESNKKFYLPFNNGDSGDWKFELETDKDAVDYGLPTRIVCQNSGTWDIFNQYQLDCLEDSKTGPQQISGFTTFGNEVDGDGEPVENSSATNTVENKGDKNVLVIGFTHSFVKGEYFKVGVVSSDCKVAVCNSYPGTTGLVDPICITLATKHTDVPDAEESFYEDYDNMFSTFKTSENDKTKNVYLVQNYPYEANHVFPPESNKKFYLPFDNGDTGDWKFKIETDPEAVDYGLPTRIVCQNSGTWDIFNQYQLDCLKDSDTGPQQISGFTTFGNEIDGDGEPVENSSATNTVEKKGDKNVLVIGFTHTFVKGEYFKVGIVSSDSRVAVCNSYPGVTGLVDPICITLATKHTKPIVLEESFYEDYDNMFSTFKTSENDKTKNVHLVESYPDEAHHVFPPESNKKFYLPFNNGDTGDWKFELETNVDAVDYGLPTRIVCQNPGIWDIFNQYQLDCLEDSKNGPQQVSGFTTFGNIVDGDGEPVENSSATNTVEKKGDKNVLVIGFTNTFAKGDYFKVGIVSSDCKVAVCNSYPGVTGLVDPICITLATKHT